MHSLNEPTMLYRKGAGEFLHGIHVDTVIVDAHEVEEKLADGWHRTPADVKSAEAAAAEQAAADAAKKAAKPKSDTPLAAT